MAITCCVLMVGKHAYEAFPAATKKVVGCHWQYWQKEYVNVFAIFCNVYWVAIEFDSSMKSVKKYSAKLK